LPGVDGREGIPGMPGAKVQPCLSQPWQCKKCDSCNDGDVVLL